MTEPRTPLDLESIERREAAATPGPWRWEVSLKSKQISLNGGKPRYDLTVMDFERWGMAGARPRLLERSSGHGLMLMTSADKFAAEVPGREHHREWFQTLNHPDAEFIAHARQDVSALVAEVKSLRAEVDTRRSEAQPQAPIAEIIRDIEQALTLAPTNDAPGFCERCGSDQQNERRLNHALLSGLRDRLMKAEATRGRSEAAHPQEKEHANTGDQRDVSVLRDGELGAMAGLSRIGDSTAEDHGAVSRLSSQRDADRGIREGTERLAEAARGQSLTGEDEKAWVIAAENADWTQVRLNGGPPCFHLEERGRFCLRAERWAGHPADHQFVSLADLLAARSPQPDKETT